MKSITTLIHTHEQKYRFGQMKLVKELESGSIEAKVSYDQRDYYHHQDNEYNCWCGWSMPGSLGAAWPTLIVYKP